MKDDADITHRAAINGLAIWLSELDAKVSELVARVRYLETKDAIDADPGDDAAALSR